MINTELVTKYRNEDGQVSRWQLAWGNGIYHLFDMEIGEPVQELPGVRYSYLRANHPQFFIGGGE